MKNGQTTGEKYEVGRIMLFASVIGLDIMRSIKKHYIYIYYG